MRATALIFVLACLALAQNPNTAVFPGSVATDADLLVVTNNAHTALAASINASATTVQLTDPSRFPAPVAITIDGEVLRCPSHTGSAYTCSRGFAGSTAAAHTAGLIVHGYMLDWHHNQLAAELKATETAVATLRNATASTFGHGTVSSVPACSGSTFGFQATDWPGYYDCISGVGQWYLGPLATAPASTVSFTGWINQGAATALATGGSVLLTGTGSAGTNLQGRLLAIPATPYTIYSCFVPTGYSTNYPFAGIVLTDGTSASTSKAELIGLMNVANRGNNTMTVVARYATNSTTAPSVTQGGPTFPAGGSYCNAVSDDGAIRKYYFSLDGGATFRANGSEAHTATLTPTWMGVAVDADQDGTAPVALFLSFSTTTSAL